MSVQEELLQELEAMSDAQRAQVLDFARFLRHREQQALDRLVDDIIDQNMEAFEELAK